MRLQHRSGRGVVNAPFALTAEELAELAEDAWREEMAELAMHNRHYREGSYTLDDWLEFSPVGRGEYAARQRELRGMTP